jgi:hypothetical protein
MTGTNGYPQYAVDLMEGQARMEAELQAIKERLDALGCVRHDERVRALEATVSKIGERTSAIAGISAVVGGALAALVSFLVRKT